MQEPAPHHHPPVAQRDVGVDEPASHRAVPVGASNRSKSTAPPGPRCNSAVRPRFDQLDGRGTAVQIIRDAPPKALVQMGPVERREAHLDVAQPSLLAGPGSTGDKPDVVDSAGGEGLLDQAVRHHVLPHGRRRSDRGAPAHQVGLGPLEDDYVVADPMQQRRRRASGDRSPDNADSHACRPEPEASWGSFGPLWFRRRLCDAAIWVIQMPTTWIRATPVPCCPYRPS